MLTINSENPAIGKKQPISGSIFLVLVFINTILLKYAFLRDGRLYYLLVLTLPLLLASAIYHIHPGLFLFTRKPVEQGVLDEMVLN